MRRILIGWQSCTNAELQALFFSSFFPPHLASHATPVLCHASCSKSTCPCVYWRYGFFSLKLLPPCELLEKSSFPCAKVGNHQDLLCLRAIFQFSWKDYDFWRPQYYCRSESDWSRCAFWFSLHATFSGNSSLVPLQIFEGAVLGYSEVSVLSNSKSEIDAFQEVSRIPLCPIFLFPRTCNGVDIWHLAWILYSNKFSQLKTFPLCPDHNI